MPTPGPGAQDDPTLTAVDTTDAAIYEDLVAIEKVRASRSALVEHNRAVRDAWDASRPPCGPILAAARKRAGLTQSEVAERLGVTQSTVASIERQTSVRLSSLSQYLFAIGAEQPHVVVTVNGADIEIPL